VRSLRSTPFVQNPKHGLLESRPKGLANLVVNRVQFLHLTFKEFLEKPEVWSMILRCTASTSFNAHISLVRAGILGLNGIKTCSDEQISRLKHETKTISKYASLAEDSTGQPQIALLDQLDRTTDLICRELHQTSSSRFDFSICGRRDCIHVSNPFLLFMLQKGLVLYARAKLRDTVRAVNQRSCKPLLEHAIFTPEGTTSGLHLPMLDFLLQEGLSPNEKSKDSSTPWRRILEELKSLGSRRMFAGIGLGWVDVCKLFLSYGANPGETFSDKISALDVIRKAFIHLPSEPVAELEAMLLQHDVTRTIGKQVSLKRKSHEYEEDSSPKRKKVPILKPHVDMPLYPGTVYERYPWSAQTRPSQELSESHGADWSKQSSRTRDRVSNHGTYGGQKDWPFQWHRSGSIYELHRNYGDSLQQWYDWDEERLKYQGHGYLSAESWQSTLYYQSHGNSRQHLNHDRTVHRRYADEPRPLGDFEHRDGPDSWYHGQDYRSFDFLAAPISYRESEPRPHYLNASVSRFQGFARRRTDG
jgi:hypothetical protein